MPRKVILEVDVYKVEELSGEAEAKALQDMREQIIEDNWYAFEDDCYEVLAGLGIDADDRSIEYDYTYNIFNYSINNLLSYTNMKEAVESGDKSKLNPFENDLIESLSKDNLETLLNILNQDGQVSLDGKHLSVDINDDEEAWDFTRKVLKPIIIKTYKTSVKTMLDYMQGLEEVSDETVLDVISANEYEYTEDGNIFTGIIK